MDVIGGMGGRSIVIASGVLASLCLVGCTDSDGLFGGGAAERSAPCSQTRALFFEGDRGWLGCSGSSGGGIYRTMDGGRSWTHASDLDDAPRSLEGQSSRFNDITRGDDGALYFCGGNNNNTPKIFLYRMSVEGKWETLVTRDTLLEGGGTGFSDCQNVAVSGDSIIIDDNAGSQIAYSQDGGQTWSKADVGQVNELTIEGGKAIGAGGTTGAGPSFYLPAEGEDLLLAAAPIAPDEGDLQEARGLATPDGGRTWLVAGAYDGPGGAWIKRSVDGGESFEEDDFYASDVAFFEEIVCLEQWCVAAGRDASDDSAIAYETVDGGTSWRKRDLGGAITPIYTAHADGDTVWMAGDGDKLLTITRPR